MTHAQPAAPSPSFAERFWALASSPDDIEALTEPHRSTVIVRSFLTVLEQIERSGRRPVPVLSAMLRAAEFEGCMTYASPEQVQGEPLDTHSIVFTLGVVLWERIAGRHPFGADTDTDSESRSERARTSEGNLNSEGLPSVPPELRTVLVRALNPFPEERWPDLPPMRETLLQFVAGDALPRAADGSTELPSVSATNLRRAVPTSRDLSDSIPKHAPRRPTPRPTTLPPIPRPGRVSTPNGTFATPRPVPVRVHPSPTAPPRLVPSVPALARPSRPKLVESSPTVSTRRPSARLEEPSQVLEDLDQTKPRPRSPSRPSRPSPAAAATGSMARAATVGEEVDGVPPDRDPARSMPDHATVLPPVDATQIARSSPRLMTFGLASAAIGAAVASMAVLLFQTSSSPPVPPPPVPATAVTPPPTGADVAEPSLPPPAAPTAPVVITDPAVILAAAIAPCLTAASPPPRMFGLTVIPRKRGARAFFGADTLNSVERNCVAGAVKTAGATSGKTITYTVHVDENGVMVREHKL